MSSTITNRKKPKIVIGANDHERLSQIAAQMEDRMPELVETLLVELERAKIVSDGAVAANVVQMGSSVTFETDAETRSVTLVYPAEADIAANKISILTPIGIALIGLSPDQVMSWTDRDGKKRQFKVLTVCEKAA